MEIGPQQYFFFRFFLFAMSNVSVDQNRSTNFEQLSKSLKILKRVAICDCSHFDIGVKPQLKGKYKRYGINAV